MSKSAAFLRCRCPRCHQGKMFAHGLYNLAHYSEMNKTCKHCGLQYEVEIGFFWGAIYVGYAFNVAIGVSTGFLTYLIFNDPQAWVYLLTVLGVIILAIPLTFRYSRVLMLYLFGSVKYDENATFVHTDASSDLKLS